MNFAVGDKVHIWLWGDAKRSGTIVQETATRFLVEFWNGGRTSMLVWRKKDEVFESLIGVDSPTADIISNNGKEEN